MHRCFSLSLALLLAATTAATADVELLDFTADSCPACRQMEPVLQGLSASGVPIRRVDVAHERELVARYGVKLLPTFVAVVDGQEVDRQVGPTSPDRLREMIDRAAQRQVASGSQETRDKRQEPTQPGQQYSPGLDSRPSTLDSSPSTLDSRLIASSVRLRVEDPQGVSYGTGTIIAARQGEAIVLTCGHLFRESGGKQPIQVELFEPGQEASASRQVAGSHDSGSGTSAVVTSLQGELLGYDLTRDVGLVRIRPTRPIYASPLAGRHLTQALQPGEKAASVGCDHGKEPTVWHTRLTAINRYVGPANVEAAGTPVQGRSGGGLFNESGELIGVCFAADDQANEGLYVGLEAIYEELDRLQLTSMVERPGATALAMDQRSPIQSTSGPQTVPPVANVDAPRGLVPVSSQDALLASETSPRLTTEERATLDEIGRRSRGGEVIVIIRPKSPGDRCEILSLDNPSQEFISQLSAIGNKATIPRFTSQKELRQQAPPEPQHRAMRTEGQAPATARRGATEWTPVPPASQ